MLATHASRQPAPVLACGVVWLGLHVRPNAFGNALGSSLAYQSVSGGSAPYTADEMANDFQRESNRYAAAAQASIDAGDPYAAMVDAFGRYDGSDVDRSGDVQLASWVAKGGRRVETVSSGQQVDLDSLRRESNIDGRFPPEMLPEGGTALGYRDKNGTMYRVYHDGGIEYFNPGASSAAQPNDGSYDAAESRRFSNYGASSTADALVPAGGGVGLGVPDHSVPTPIPADPIKPVSNGTWSDPTRPGNSGWMSTTPSVNAVTGGKPVQFRNGMVNFDPWTRMRLNIPTLTGNSNADLRLGRDALGTRLGLPTDAAVTTWLKTQALTLHHNPNGVSLDLVPSALHNVKNGGIPHTGGASILRNWDYSKGSPVDFLNANRIATGARFVGGAAMAYGAYSDAKSLYGQYQISQQTGSYSNTLAEGTRIAGGWAGAWAVGAAGAQFGAGLGTLFGPVGIVVGGVVGGAVGGMLGYAGGSYAAPRIAQDVGLLTTAYLP